MSFEEGFDLVSCGVCNAPPVDWKYTFVCDYCDEHYCRVGCGKHCEHYSVCEHCWDIALSDQLFLDCEDCENSKVKRRLVYY